MTHVYYSFANKEKSTEMLNFILEKYYGILKSEQIILRNENGKPYLKSGKVFFNITHTEGLIMAVVSDSPVGIDAEFLSDNENNYRDVAKKYFSEKENSVISSYKDFLTVWTKKESVIKAEGGSVIKDLKHVLFENKTPVYYGEQKPYFTISFALSDYVYSVTAKDAEYDSTLLL